MAWDSRKRTRSNGWNVSHLSTPRKLSNSSPTLPPHGPLHGASIKDALATGNSEFPNADDPTWLFRLPSSHRGLCPSTCSPLPHSWTHIESLGSLPLTL